MLISNMVYQHEFTFMVNVVALRDIAENDKELHAQHSISSELGYEKSSTPSRERVRRNFW